MISSGTGGFIFLIGFFGCCGALQESRCLLWIVSNMQNYTITHGIITEEVQSNVFPITGSV